MDRRLDIGDSYVVDTEDSLPIFLCGRAPFKLQNTEIIFRNKESEVLGANGQVLMAGAIEFQTQISPGSLSDVCDPNEIYSAKLQRVTPFRCVYDPEIQRGMQETKQGGYKEFLREAQVKSMMEDIMENRFECPPLMWNLRAGETSWAYLRKRRELCIYEGAATRPDSNHRHHAIINIHKKYLKWVREAGSTDMEGYNPQRGYGLAIYTDDFNGEARRFYVYNFKGSQVSTSTAHYIESKTNAPQLHTRLARELMENSGILGGNVEILNNHLSRNSAKIITFGTLVEALKEGFPALTEDVYDEIKDYLLKFLDELSKARPDEIRLLSVAQRQKVRYSSIVDQAVLWHGYIRLAARFRELKIKDWPACLNTISRKTPSKSSDSAEPDDDIFSRRNPAWSRNGVIAPGKTGPRVVNNRQARQGAYEYLCKLVGIPSSKSQKPSKPDSQPSPHSHQNKVSE
jgi:hypothetical protein